MTYIDQKTKITKLKRLLKKYNSRTLPKLLKKIKFKREHKELVDTALSTFKNYDALKSHQETRLKTLLERQYLDETLKVANMNYEHLVLSFTVEEVAENLYQKSLQETNSWNDWNITDKFPKSNSEQATQAISYVLKKMEEKYASEFGEEKWNLIKNVMKDKIHAGLT